jgi:uncharacterized membrane protein YhaH (DUF805 family)
MSFQDAVRTCLQQKYADFNGRARRSELWYFVLFTIIAGFVATVIDAILHTPKIGTNGLVAWVVTLALLVPMLAVGARRLHDTGRPTWLVAGYLLTLVGSALSAASSTLGGLVSFVGGIWTIVLIIFWIQDSKPDNEYGPNPKSVGGGEYGQPYQQMPPPAPPQY